MSKEKHYFMLYNEQSIFSGLIYQTRQLAKYIDNEKSVKEVISHDYTRYTPEELDFEVDLLTLEYPGGWVVIELTDQELNPLLNRQVGLIDINPFLLENNPFKEL
ncbi:hypothetical protein [Lysinibacillus sp. 3P01SB]|uniref:hypothetical protein n=1 Tax=Lysinibacillus sp. 3P01SB TaxID=3132284 RepID=UPI0039A49AB3